MRHPGRARWSLPRRLSLAHLLWAAALSCFLLPGPAPAQAAAPPDLRGVWQATYAAPTATGRIVRQCSFEVTRQEGELFWGVDAWHPVDPKTGQASTEWIRSPFLGSLSPNGDGGAMAVEDMEYSFRLVGTDQMELEMVSLKDVGGFPPTAFYAVLKRGGVGSLPTATWPALSGTWSGECLVAQPGKTRPSSVRLDFVRQDGELLWVDDVWSPLGPLTATTDPRSVLRERMVGSLNPAGTGGVLAKQGVSVAFRLVGPDRMEVEYIRVLGEHEEPTAFYAVLRKEGVEPISPVAGSVNLVGTWQLSYRYALPDRPVEATSSLVITRQEGNLVWADDVWAQAGEQGSAPVMHRDAVAGSLSPDQARGALAKPGASFRLRVLDADRLEVRFVRTADRPTVFHAIARRQR